MTAEPRDNGGWIQLALTPSRPSPWLQDTTSVLFRPGSSTVFLYEASRVPEGLANTIRSDAGLPTVHSSGGIGALKWGVLVGWIPIVIALGLVWTRRRGRPTAAPA